MDNLIKQFFTHVIVGLTLASLSFPSHGINSSSSLSSVPPEPLPVDNPVTVTPKGVYTDLVGISQMDSTGLQQFLSEHGSNGIVYALASGINYDALVTFLRQQMQGSLQIQLTDVQEAVDLAAIAAKHQIERNPFSAVIQGLGPVLNKLNGTGDSQVVSVIAAVEPNVRGVSGELTGDIDFSERPSGARLGTGVVSSMRPPRTRRRNPGPQTMFRENRAANYTLSLVQLPIRVPQDEETYELLLEPQQENGGPSYAPTFRIQINNIASVLDIDRQEQGFMAQILQDKNNLANYFNVINLFFRTAEFIDAGVADGGRENILNEGGKFSFNYTHYMNMFHRLILAKSGKVGAVSTPPGSAKLLIDEGFLPVFTDWIITSKKIEALKKLGRSDGNEIFIPAGVLTQIELMPRKDTNSQRKFDLVGSLKENKLWVAMVVGALTFGQWSGLSPEYVGKVTGYISPDRYLWGREIHLTEKRAESIHKNTVKRGGNLSNAVLNTLAGMEPEEFGKFNALADSAYTYGMYSQFYGWLEEQGVEQVNFATAFPIFLQQTPNIGDGRYATWQAVFDMGKGKIENAQRDFPDNPELGAVLEAINSTAVSPGTTLAAPPGNQLTSPQPSSLANPLQQPNLSPSPQPSVTTLGIPESEKEFTEFITAALFSDALKWAGVSF